MDYSKLSWNASDELDIVDDFLSLPKTKNKYSRTIVSILGKVINFIEKVCLYIEPREIHFNERKIELAFVLQRLPSAGYILDVGCSNSSLALQLACMDYKVTGIDVRDYKFSHRNLEFIQEDISRFQGREKYYDSAILVSIIEHIGFGHYGEPDSLSDREILKIVSHFVKPSGSIIITIPFGVSFESNWYRVYDPCSLNMLIDGFLVLSKKFAKRTSLLEWILCKEEDLINVSSENLPMNGIALLEIRKNA